MSGRLKREVDNQMAVVTEQTIRQAELASALLVVWDGGVDKISGVVGIKMGLLADLTNEAVSGVDATDRKIARLLDKAGVWRHHNGGHTLSSVWLHPDTGKALQRLVDAANPPEPEPEPLPELDFSKMVNLRLPGIG